MANSNVLVDLEMASKGGAVIPIHYGAQTTVKRKKMDKFKRKKPSQQSMTNIQNAKVERQEQLQNKKILYAAKRGYSILLLVTVLLLGVLSLYVIKINDTLSHYLYNGTTGCIISLILMVPIFLLFRFVEKKIIFQHDTINNKIIENFSLKQQLDSKHDQNVSLQQEVNQSQLVIAEQEQKINKLSSGKSGSTLNIDASKYNFQLIHGFRKGQMEIQIEYAQIDELISMFNVVVSCITLLPFGQTNLRKTLKKILIEKIEKNKYLQMHFYFFLLSYVECADVKRLFRKHRIMKKVKSLADFYQYNDKDFDDGITIFSETNTVFSERSAPFTPYSPENETGMAGLPKRYLGSPEMGQFPDTNSLPHKRCDNASSVGHEDVIYFKEKDPIKLFRAPIDNKSKPGTIIIVPKELQNRFFDPINGNKFLQQLTVRHIFSSNAKPYLIDCYVKDTEMKYNEQDSDINDSVHGSRMKYDGMQLSSSFILKKGDDLRKDQAILQMFKFMNDIWKENNLKYQKGKYFVECLIYKCIPMGNDVGIIEMISDCIELNKVKTLQNIFMSNITPRDEIIARQKFNKLITSSAAAYIASFICGVRDRHHDNVLINLESCALFHIDFGYIFNDSTTLDTARFAITSDLKKIFNAYGNGWHDFIDLASRAWMTLRQNSTELIDFARAAFAFLYKSNDIEQFIRDSLKLDLNQDSALKYIYSHLTKAPKQWRTKMKNLAHTFAQKMKKKKSATIDLSAPKSTPSVAPNMSPNMSPMFRPEVSVSNVSGVGSGSIRLPANIITSYSPGLTPHITPKSARGASVADIITAHHMNIVVNSDRKRASSTQIVRAQTQRINSRRSNKSTKSTKSARAHRPHKSVGNASSKSIILGPPKKNHNKTLSLIV